MAVTPDGKTLVVCSRLNTALYACLESPPDQRIPMLTRPGAWLRAGGFSLLLGGLTLPPPAAGALEPSAAVAEAQKRDALQLFADDARVQAALKVLAGQGYRVVSTDLVPYRFVYGDEGPATSFLVTAWLGKSAAYGWSSSFVMARVNTDAFGPPTVRLIDATDVQRFLR